MGEDGMDGVEPVEGVMVVVVHFQEAAGYQEQRLMVW